MSLQRAACARAADSLYIAVVYTHRSHVSNDKTKQKATRRNSTVFSSAFLLVSSY